MKHSFYCSLDGDTIDSGVMPVSGPIAFVYQDLTSVEYYVPYGPFSSKDLRYDSRKALCKEYERIFKQLQGTLPSAQIGSIASVGQTVDPTFDLLTAEDPSILEDILQDALEDFDMMDTSTILYAHDLGELPALAKQLANTVGKLTKVSKVPKAVAGAYLAFKYGVETFVRDTATIYENTRDGLPDVSSDITKLRARSPWRSSRGRLSGRPVLWCEQHNLTIFRQRTTDPVYRLLDVLYQYGNPINTTIWDFVPFSFVVDWFVHANEYTQYLDDDGLLKRTTFDTALGSQSLFCTMPWVYRISVPLADGRTVAFGGTVTSTKYIRRVLSRLPSLRFQNPGSPELTHWVEGFALTVQNTGRRR